jgi:hypothetical protein
MSNSVDLVVYEEFHTKKLFRWKGVVLRWMCEFSGGGYDCYELFTAQTFVSTDTIVDMWVVIFAIRRIGQMKVENCAF